MKQLTHILIGLVLSVTLLLSCEELYKPTIDIVSGPMVVDSHITNDPNNNYVTLSKTRNFYSNYAVEWISGANVELVQDNFQIIKGREDVPGYYIFAATPVPGNRYKLRISVSKDVYESDYIVMPPIPQIDRITAKHNIDKIYRINGFGVPELFNLPGREIAVDVPVTPKTECYMFRYRAVIQWKYVPKVPYDSTLDYTPEDTLKLARIKALEAPSAKPDTSIKILYGWKSIADDNLFNIAGPKEFSTSRKIENHHIVSLAYDSTYYLDSLEQKPYNWIIILDEYGIPKESYDYLGQLNKQFKADGSLFEPVLSQVYGNILCKTDPSKIAMGFFNLNSYRQYRYYINLGNENDFNLVFRPLKTFYDISDHGFRKGKPPVFWETN